MPRRRLAARGEQDGPVAHRVGNQSLAEETGSAADLSRLAAEQQKELQRLDGGGSVGGATAGSITTASVPLNQIQITLSWSTGKA